MPEQIEFEFTGEVVESDELLNGTRTLAFSGASADGGWQVDGSLSWNLGLVEFAGEGDITLSRQDGELYGTLASVDVREAAEAGDGDVAMVAAFEIDGGTGALADLAGRLAGRIHVRGTEISGAWTVDRRHPPSSE